VSETVLGFIPPMLKVTAFKIFISIMAITLVFFCNVTLATLRNSDKINATKIVGLVALELWFRP
jgi:hypothetical protein